MKEAFVVKCQGNQESPANLPKSCEKFKRVPKGCKRVPNGYRHQPHWAKGSPKEPPCNNMDGSVAKHLFFIDNCCPKNRFCEPFWVRKWFKIGTQVNAEPVEKMMPNRIQNDEQMNPKRMHNSCIFWKGDLAQNICLEIIFNVCSSKVSVNSMLEHLKENGANITKREPQTDLKWLPKHF